MPRTLYLDDLAVGDQFATQKVTLTLEGCKAFAAEFDPQPFHLDEAAGRHSVFVLDVRVSESKPDRGIVTVRNRTLNQHGEAVQLAVVKMLVPKRPA
jgi:acyl dehydratase